MWHASIACQGKKGPLPTKILDAKTRNFMIDLGKSLLDSVGCGEWFIKFGESAIHVRKALSYYEIEGLPSEWLAIPAIDGDAP